MTKSWIKEAETTASPTQSASSRSDAATPGPIKRRKLEKPDTDEQFSQLIRDVNSNNNEVILEQTRLATKVLDTAATERQSMLQLLQSVVASQNALLQQLGEKILQGQKE